MKKQTDTFNWVHILKFYSHNKERAKYPVPIYENDVGFFTSHEKAVRFMKDGLKQNKIGCYDLKTENKDFGDIPLFFIIERWKTNICDIKYLSERYYDHKGKFMGIKPTLKKDREPFYGVNPGKHKYKKGDIVQFYDSRTEKEIFLETGIVCFPPSSKAEAKKSLTKRLSRFMYNKYFVVNKNNHVHLCECELMPVNPQMLTDKIKQSLFETKDKFKDRKI
ncbi:MAG: hypothetical protein ACD_79C00062G0003 [uncultured bacterium]|nr:MAG: hypothetical protein ACD_79C00062G0003 [uncultured bacterium]